MLPDFIRILSSLDDNHKLRFASGLFALNRASLFAESTVHHGLKEAEIIFKKSINISLRLKDLKMYELVLITMFAVLELSKIKTFSENSFSKALTELFYSVMGKIKFMISFLRLEESAEDLMLMIHSFYPAYVKNCNWRTPWGPGK